LTAIDDCLVGGPHLYTLSLTTREPMGFGVAMVRSDWLALASMWMASTRD
jgi:hypothetical protein